MEKQTKKDTATAGRTAAPSLPPGLRQAFASAGLRLTPPLRRKLARQARAGYGEWLEAVCGLLGISPRIGSEALAPRLMDDFRSGMPPAAAAQKAREWITPIEN